MTLNSLARLWALKSRVIFEATSCPPTSSPFIIFAQGNTALSLASGPSLSLDKELPSASGLLSAALCKKKCASLYVLGKTYEVGESLAGSKLYACDICGKVVTQPLDQHFERKHKLTHAAAKVCFRLIKEEESGKKMLKCSLSNKVYKNLTHHLLNNHGLMPSSAESHQIWTEAKHTVEDTMDFYSEGPSKH